MNNAMIQWIVTAIAILSGPLIAVQVTRFLDNKKEIRDRQLRVFKILMATRGCITSPQHVEALNNIDLEFSSKCKKEKEILDAWKAYLDMLSEDLSKDSVRMECEKLFVALLYCMAEFLDYELDKTYIKKKSYYPKEHGDIKDQQRAMLTALLKVFQGEKPLYVINEQPTSEKI